MRRAAKVGVAMLAFATFANAAGQIAAPGAVSWWVGELAILGFLVGLVVCVRLTNWALD